MGKKWPGAAPTAPAVATSSERGDMANDTCGWCDHPLHGRHQKTYCSRRCAQNVRAVSSGNDRSDIPWRECRRCACWFVGRGSGSGTSRRYFCSDGCASEQRRADRTPRPRIFVEGPCAWCGNRFTIVDQLTSRYCSRMCLKYADRQRRGKRFIVTPAVRRSIYERDGWACQICGDPIDRNADPARDDWAPTLDHIVPRSIALEHWPDGVDQPTNLRTAHRWCNSVRGDGSSYDDELATPELLAARHRDALAHLKARTSA